MDMKQVNSIDTKTLEDLQLESKLDKEIRNILSDVFITKDAQLDLKEGTDFLIYSVNPFKIGVRLRRYKFYLNENYRTQFTIRWKRRTNIETEIDKIRKGLVDYILYGFVNKDETKIIQYFIGDLKIFRENEPKPFQIKTNMDCRCSEFAIYNLKDFSSDFIIHSKGFEGLEKETGLDAWL